LHLAQHTHDLGFCVSCLLHRNLLSHPAEKILLPHPVKIGGDYQASTIQTRSCPAMLRLHANWEYDMIWVLCA
ncbi:hypothetical protein J7376_13935, partial [Paracoccus sp. R12_1]|uniref:hypothetical protein n=1 Tax=unclassified Paracoccus (in: a-proteobacteria) TaxID=2688777 RepID=UPI001ADA0B72